MQRIPSIALTILLLAGTLAAFGWGFFRCLRRSDDPARFLFKSFLTLLFTGGLLGFAAWIGPSVGGALTVPFLCVAYGVVMSILWAPQVARFFAKPLTSIFDGGDEEPDPQPLYSAAEARIKRGHFQQAAFAIKEQLQRFPNDYYGQMLLARLQAEHLNDLPGAEVTIQRLCNQSGHPRKSLALALQQLAEWHLKLTQDIPAAQAAFQRILEIFPNTDEAHTASQRLAHLGTTEDLLKPFDRQTVRLRPGLQNIGLLKNPAVASQAAEDPTVLAANYVRHLEAHPYDEEAREKLAWIYARHYGRLDLALDQIDQLVRAPDQSVKQVARWLNVIADLQLAFGSDPAPARAALERVIELMPETPTGEAARQRLATLALETRSRQPVRTIKLGTYETNLGLKQGPPRA